VAHGAFIRNYLHWLHHQADSLIPGEGTSCHWIPACAGMTMVRAGMTTVRGGMTMVRTEMTVVKISAPQILPRFGAAM